MLEVIQILNLIKDTQSFITCVNHSFLEDINDYKIYKIENGNLKEVTSGQTR